MNQIYDRLRQAYPDYLEVSAGRATDQTVIKPQLDYLKDGGILGRRTLSIELPPS